MQKSDAAEQLDKEFIHTMAGALSDTKKTEMEAIQIIAEAIPLIDRLLSFKK